MCIPAHIVFSMPPSRTNAHDTLSIISLTMCLEACTFGISGGDDTKYVAGCYLQEYCEDGEP